MGETTMATSEEQRRDAAKRIREVKLKILYNNAFYAHLLLHLEFKFAPCKTAATNMKKMIFDPEFVYRISDDELEFVILHELMHCALMHCVRGKGLNSYIYNVACDIVVNSSIMKSWGVDSFTIDNSEVMHLAPDGNEGYLYSAEDVYEMITQKHDALICEVNQLLKELEQEYGVSFDEHEIWKTVPFDEELIETWKQTVKEAASYASETEVPPVVRDELNKYESEGKADWKSLLHEFVQDVNENFDYSFMPPDKRFSSGEFIIPFYTEIHEEKIDNLWFVVDTSASIDDEMLSLLYSEICFAMEQFYHLSGRISFFDTKVSAPVEFDDIESLRSVEPVGGGGTSFHAIFNYMRENMKDNLPVAVIIMTDGYAAYPPEEMAMDVPVMWILINNSADMPWGVSVHIDTD